MLGGFGANKTLAAVKATPTAICPRKVKLTPPAV
jgi:hypothetical protein